MVNLLEKNEQTGRSMVEMLGVLAIIGVLSVGGIAGYSKAMTKFKITKTFDQVSMMVANIRTLYSGQRNYNGLATDIAMDMGVVPAEMEGPAEGELINAFQGGVEVYAVEYNAKAASAFAVSYGNMGREACVQIITSDWGSGASSGFIGLDVRAGTDGVDGLAAVAVNADNVGDGTGSWGNNNMPVTPATAAQACQCANDQCAITWFYM